MHGGDVFEGEETVSSIAKLARCLGSAEHQKAKDGGLVAAEVQYGADAVLVFGDSAVVKGRDEVELGQGVERLTDFVFGELEYGIAAGALIASVDECVQREGVVLRGGDLFFDK